MEAEKLKLVRIAHAATDAYQPVFSLESEFPDRKVSRDCRDRCAVLSDELGADIKNLRILDVGCSLGYISLFFADKGATVTGLDYNNKNIEFCRTLASALALPAEFENRPLSNEYCRDLDNGRYDVIFLFSVLHHVVTDRGLQATTAMLESLLSKADVLYVELAQKSENVRFKWRDALPENDLDVFNGIRGVKIEKVGDFPALGETTIRPMYKVWKTEKRLNGLLHRDLEVKRSSIKDGRTSDRKYIFSSEFMTKAYVFSPGTNTYGRFNAELSAYQRIGNHPNFPRILGSDLDGRLGLLTMPRLDGVSLQDAINAGEVKDIRAVALNLISVLRGFADAGLFWNDFRTHNLMFSDGVVYAVDLEGASPIEMEHTLNLFVWMLIDLQGGRTVTHQQALANVRDLRLVQLPTVENRKFSEEIRDIAEIALSSNGVRDFLSKAIRLA